MTTTTTIEQPTYAIVSNGAGAWNVLVNGEVLTDSTGMPRTFNTRATARKRISRERSGNFHK